MLLMHCNTHKSPRFWGKVKARYCEHELETYLGSMENQLDLRTSQEITRSLGISCQGEYVIVDDRGRVKLA